MFLRDLLQREIKDKARSHAYLLVGDEAETQSGVDFLIKELGCESFDISYLTPIDESGKKGEIKVAETKAFLREINLSPRGQCRIGIITKAERLNPSSANMLLKMLEEPPALRYFILTATTDSVIATITSRCRVYKAPSRRSDHTTSYFPSILTINYKELFDRIEETVKANEIAKLIDESQDYLESRLLNGREKSTADLLAETETTRHRIGGNANPKLALAALIIKIRGNK